MVSKLLLALPALILMACANHDDPNKYGYGPTILKKDGVIYIYFCSAGSTGWDAVRLTVSKDDGKTWSGPQVMLDSNGTDRCACDPSIVFFKGYYYLFYSGNIKDIQTANFVSRSESPYGPFLKYGNGRWGEEANPMPITLPEYPTPDGPTAWYGAGQPSVIVRGDTLLMWYTDIRPPGNTWINFTASTDGINWTTPIYTNLPTASIDVKFNTQTGKYNMFGMVGNELGSGIGVYESDDGITWSSATFLHNVNDYAHNPGVSGNELGELLDQPFVGFGGPRNFEKVDRWPEWDLYIMDLIDFVIQPIVKTKG